jgi:lysophospholipase L1-like esterase
VKRNIIWIGLSIVIAVVMAEIALTLFFPIADPNAERKSRMPDMEYIESQFFPNEAYVFFPEKELSHMSDRARFTTDNMGFRGRDVIMPKPADEYRIFMVGGSTTECLYLDDEATITADLEALMNARRTDSLKVRVYNAGKGGDKSYDHIAMISHRIVFLQPDMIILFAGINDLLAATADVDYLHYPEKRRTAFSLSDLVGLLATEFQIPRRLSIIFHSRSDLEIREALPFHSNYKNLAQLRKSYPLSKTPPHTDLAAFATNLRTIIGICRTNDIQLVLLTQPTTWNSRLDTAIASWHWMNCSNQVSYREADLDRAMEQYNDVTRRLATDYNLPLVDLGRVVPKSSQFMYDDCHFNLNGARFAAECIAKLLRSDLYAGGK